MAVCWHQANWRAVQNRAGCPWAGSYHNKANRLVWKTRPNSCPLGPGLKLERKLWKEGDEMRWEEKRRGGGKETRPDGLVCREKEIAAGAHGVRQGEGERARTELAPTEMMEDRIPPLESGGASVWWKKEAMNLIWWLNRHISVAAGHKDDQVQAQFVCICICLQILNGLWVEFSEAWLHFCRNNQ